MFKKSCKILFMLMFIIIALLFLTPPASVDADAELPSEESSGYQYYRGEIVSVENHETEGLLKQETEVHIKSGPYRGNTVNVLYHYQEASPYSNIYLTEGMEVILGAKEAENGGLENIFISEIVRDRGLYFLTGLFVFLILVVGRKQGWKTLITLFVTALIIVRVLLPLLLKGYDPIILATFCAIGITVFILLFIGGWNAKSFSAIVGTACGIVAAGFIAFWVGEISYLTGFNSEEAQALYYLNYTIDIRGLLFAGIIIGSLGAVSDVGMSVASAAAEIKEVNPKIPPYQIVKSAMNVGRDIMGTMSNTLILAYVGSSTPLILLILSYDIDWLRIINMDLVATEIVRGMAGTIGLVITIPATALMAGITLKNSSTKKAR